MFQLHSVDILVDAKTFTVEMLLNSPLPNNSFTPHEIKYSKIPNR